MKLTAIIVVGLALTITSTANAHLVKKVHKNSMRSVAHRQAERNYRHAAYVCVRGSGKPKREHCRALPWIKKVLAQTAPLPPRPKLGGWIVKQIRVATLIAQSATIDPWPNCPDPFFNGASWQDTVNCENGGNWYDSPGHFRCGLQFEPFWERIYGRLCP